MPRSPHNGLGTANPFFHRGPVRDLAYFFGRTCEIALLTELPRQGQSVAISGQRRLGKTSLLCYLADPTIATGHGLGPETTCWVYLDGGMSDGLDEQALHGEVDRALGGEHDTVPYARFVDRLSDISARNPRLILVLDAFELVAANPTFCPALFNWLRGLAARFPMRFIPAFDGGHAG